jgi:hypothetical protein
LRERLREMHRGTVSIAAQLAALGDPLMCRRVCRVEDEGALECRRRPSKFAARHRDEPAVDVNVRIVGPQLGGARKIRLRERGRIARGTSGRDS